MGGAAACLTLHASTVAFRGRGVLVLGASGSGKSALALDLLALGADLVADDRTEITRDGDSLVASCPAAIRGRIEARFVGILNAAPHPPVALALAVDLDRTEEQRLPPMRQCHFSGLPLPLLHNTAHRHFAAAIRQYVLHGRHA